MGRFYDDPSFGVLQRLTLRGKAAQTSVRASQVVADRRTFMENVTVTDWNVHFVDGATTTGAAATTAFKIGIGKSLAGTGAISLIGTALCGTQANGTVQDGSVTETTFNVGDDIVLTYEAGTALPAGAVQVEADVMYKERYT